MIGIVYASPDDLFPLYKQSKQAMRKGYDKGATC
ncbi:hypothetical protein UFOVP930_31 [uncultured Caudovirales phage]|uniref:Uncharacterized protein n=1 Tax=uncultured Caudovirales phage TaxID=2100421 RepID=A0A6J5PRI0_9CAUD|nr:hypothetical protein UFOVP930_31 [uncultured Caudovirales phage]CAB4200333.1 hypothetical protein UFOVP1354_35 [uncultured Caudovirales phage]CAB5238447.1 hypothetical protein UFOVP1547_20 [uncultured Caudovirales phage]